MEPEQRVATIEADVTKLKADVGSINGKLDEVLEAMARMSTRFPPARQHDAQHKNTSATDRDSDGASSAAQNDKSPQSRQTQTSASNTHHVVDAQLSLDEFVHRESQRDRFEASHNGRNNFSSDAFLNRIIAKPYMYLSRDGISSVKQKLDARQTVTPLEYVDATLALLSDPRAFDVNDYVDIMFHLRKVTRDSLERPWPSVRRWTQYVWDAVEAGEFTWADREQIQEERVRLCLTNPGSVSSITSKQATKTETEVICRAFNTRIGCKFQESHGDHHITQLHCCSYCDSVGRQCFHSVRECERRLAHTRNDNSPHGQYQQRNRRQNYGQQQPAQFQQRNQVQQFNPYSQNNNNQYSKNAM